MFLKRFRSSRVAGTRPKSAAEYIAAYRATGDLVLLGELYEQHMELVYAVCFNYLRDEEEAKDAVMQLFEQLITDLRRHDVQNFQAWLHSVARNYCLMQLRSRKTYAVASLTNTPDLEQQLHTNSGTDATDQLDLEANLTQLETCLQTLPNEQRVCLTLFYLEHKSYADVAELTGFDLKKVKSCLQNGRRNLKICLSK
ncbi:RNA polymerase sigma factor [Spirosoma sp. KUDC1026]|uniref:RNA polymerase sigma factor n=1 Tax=Spirosoma sp. KUDC1026 TaxID=2745947 RepID=UPI00159BDBD2|nr:sigma-70 family RNA polymerase sigma factor [Spirosoma sp. KUDC1026]QKZ12854.1 sigma-70 family RNA polymerase sigma factor [Spirosoma sp. KUDC1026]